MATQHKVATAHGGGEEEEENFGKYKVAQRDGDSLEEGMEESVIVKSEPENVNDCVDMISDDTITKPESKCFSISF